MDTKALRQKILDLAIRGKLVPQDPNDESASVLIERIRAEKLQMVKDGKLKPKDIKNDTIIFKGDDNLHYENFSDGSVKCIEDEIPFEVPDNWEWCRFCSYTLNRDNERKPVSSVQRKKVKKIYDYYGASGVIDQTDSFLFDEKLLLIGEDGANLLARTKPVAFLTDGKYWVNNHAHCIDSIDKKLLNFICIYINAINLFQYVTGSAQPKLNQDNMNRILIPIPPMAEQEKILERIKIILSNINDIDLLKGKLQSNIANAKSKILDLAIRGKLVPQDPNDEPASVLLERIRDEKEELIKQGKIKRDKKESVIFKGDDNSYYQDLPSNWINIRLSAISEIITKGTTPRGGKIAYSQSGIGFLRAENIAGYDKLDLLNLNYVDEESHKNYLKRSILKENDILITIAGTLGRTAIVPQHTLPLNCNQAVAIVRLVNNKLINVKYLAYTLNSPIIKNDLLAKSVDMAIPNLSLDNIAECNILLPPLLEQKRIVDEIEKIFATLDDIANQLA